MTAWLLCGLFAWEAPGLTGSPRLMARTLAHLHPDTPIFYLDPLHLTAVSQALLYRAHERGPLWRVVRAGGPWGAAGHPGSAADWRHLSQAHPLVWYSTSYHLGERSWMQHLAPEVWVYSVLENAVALMGPERQVHERALARADVVVSNSPPVTQSLAGLVNPAKLLEWGMAVHPDFWERTAIPPCWTFGFFGHLMPWIDFDALEELAAQHPRESIALVGPLHKDSASLVTALCQRRPSIHWLGPRPYEDLPDFAAACEVMLLPRRRSPVSDACDPVKLYEYLAAAKPVATNFPVSPALGRFVYSGATPIQFAAAAAAALADARSHLGRHRDPALPALLADRSWTARAGAIWDRTAGPWILDPAAERS